MGSKGLEFFFRIAGILLIFALFCVFVTDKGTPEFIMSVYSIILSSIVLIITAILIRKKRGE